MEGKDGGRKMKESSGYMFERGESKEGAIRKVRREGGRS